MNYEHDIDTSNEIASEALERMHADGLPPVPNNFEVWYAYFARVNKGLCDAINDIVAKKGKLSAQECEALHKKFLDNEEEQDLYKKAGDQINSTIQDVSGLIKTVKESTSEYTGSLSGVNEKLAQAETPKQMETVVQDIMQDTLRMVENNKKLEQDLEKSSRAIQELRRDMDKIRREAMTDGLTGLVNRKSFDEQIARYVEKADKGESEFALLLLDIDHFKKFNDTYGHQVGDQVLRLVARTLVEGVKGKDVAARYGGEEFAIILPDSGLSAGVAVGENLRKTVEAKEVINRSTGDMLGRITMSVGVTQFYPDDKADAIIERADTALYKAKNNGRNMVSAASPPAEKKKAG